MRSLLLALALTLPAASARAQDGEEEPQEQTPQIAEPAEPQTGPSTAPNLIQPRRLRAPTTGGTTYSAAANPSPGGRDSSRTPASRVTSHAGPDGARGGGNTPLFSGLANGSSIGPADGTLSYRQEWGTSRAYTDIVTHRPGGIRFTIYNSMEEAPRAGNTGHRAAPLTGPGQGYAMGFVTKTGGGPGNCRAAKTPAVPSGDACLMYVWVSASPGGKAIKGCAEGPIMGDGINLNWISGPNAAAYRMPCTLQAGRMYFCHYTATGWDHPEHPPRACGAAYGSPLVQ